MPSIASIFIFIGAVVAVFILSFGLSITIGTVYKSNMRKKLKRDVSWNEVPVGMIRLVTGIAVALVFAGLWHISTSLVIGGIITVFALVVAAVIYKKSKRTA